MNEPEILQRYRCYGTTTGNDTGYYYLSANTLPGAKRQAAKILSGWYDDARWVIERRVPEDDRFIERWESVAGRAAGGDLVRWATYDHPEMRAQVPE